MDRNRELAARLVDALRPKLVDLIAELLDEERGVTEDDGPPPRLPGVSQEDYERCLRMARCGGKTRRKTG